MLAKSPTHTTNNDANIIHYNKLAVVIPTNQGATLNLNRHMSNVSKRNALERWKQLDPYASQNCIIWNQSRKSKETRAEKAIEKSGNRHFVPPAAMQRIRFFFAPFFWPRFLYLCFYLPLLSDFFFISCHDIWYE